MEDHMPIAKRLTAEFLGTLWLVLGGCGTAVISTGTGSTVGQLGVALAFGLTVLTAAYAFGHVSGAHFNPAVTVGLWAGRRFEAKDVVPYIIAQVLGAIAGAGLIYLVASQKPGFGMGGGFASNGFAEHSPMRYELMGCFAAEVLLTFFFVIVILGATHGRAPKGFAPLAIGLSFTLIHLISIPVTNTSVNPARSTGPAVLLAIVLDNWAINQLWLFWLAPILGALLAGFLFGWISPDETDITGEIE